MFPECFQAELLQQLETQLYLKGEVIQAHDDIEFHDLILVSQGYCSVYGFTKILGETTKLKVVELGKHSWFGDINILLNVSNFFELRAERPADHKTQNFSNLIQVYKFSRQRLLHMCQKHPHFKKFLVARAIQRRAYWFTVISE